MFLNDLQMFFENASLNGLETVSNCIEDKLNIYLKLFALLYADDTVLMAETHDDLQNILNKFGEYCNTWRLKANTDKTKVIVFSRGRQSTNLKFTLNGSELEIVNEFNYLGILFNRTGNFNKAIKKQAEKATKAMFEVLKRGRTHNLSIECQLELFNKMVKPILLYGSEIWGFSKNIQCLEKVQLRFCKLLLKLKTSTPSYMIYGELGLFPIEIDVKLRMISYWARLLTGKETKLSYLSYKILYNLFIDENLDFSWIKHVKHIFDDTGYSYIWSQQFFQNSDLLLALIRNRLHEQFTQEWHSLIQNSPKAINYRLFKDNFEFENYFNILEDKDIYTLCKFRTTNHKLPIETGRWNGIDRENRQCLKCNSRSIGDEFHYIMECHFFTENRTQLISRYLTQRPNILKFKQIMCTSEKIKLEKLCRFIRKINQQIRSSLG